MRTPETKITPEMIDAGAWMLCDVFRLCGRLQAEGIAKIVYEAMSRASRKSVDHEES